MLREAYKNIFITAHLESHMPNVISLDHGPEPFGINQSMSSVSGAIFYEKSRNRADTSRDPDCNGMTWTLDTSGSSGNAVLTELVQTPGSDWLI